MTFREIERPVKKNGWFLSAVSGFHYQYLHNEKKGKVTIPRHSGDINQRVINSILKQAELR